MADRAGGSGTAQDSLGDQIERGRKQSGTRLERGRTVQRYVVLYELGSGGMGVVYAAYDPELDRKIALKLLHADSTSTRGRTRLLREAKAIAKLSHPNVVTVHDVGTFEGRVFVAMEYVDGVTLRQWLREKQRPWQEVLEVLTAAGQGLAAAHAADLIHRDFKPDNVLVDRAGRVVVLDFGLARRATSHDDSHSSSSERSPRPVRSDTGTARIEIDPAAAERPRVHERPDELDVELTRTGAVLGTPAYMSPEQHLGVSVDARTDQFSFCVVLWEALWGVRPFRGDTARITAVNVVKGIVDDPPRHVRVPNWLRRVLVRGLAVDVPDRYPHMNALLAALRRESTRKVRRGIALAAGIVGLGVGAVIAAATLERDRESCDGGEARLVGVWDDDVRSRIRTAFLDTEVPYAQTAFVGVERELDEYAEGWQGEHREACEATHVLREQSHEMLDLRMACLRARLGELEALTSEFSGADADVVEHAVEATATLGRLDACADTEALAARVRPPEDPAARQRVETLRERLRDAKAKEASGRYEAALAIAEDVVAQAVSLEYPPVTAEARLRLGSVLERKGDFIRSERELLDAILQAEASEHQIVAAEAWVRLVWVTGVERMDTDKGQLWAQFADAAVRRLGRNDLLRAQLVHNDGGLLYRQGDYAGALDRYRRALEMQEQLLGPDDPLVAMTYNHLGNVMIMQGDLVNAREYCRRSLELRRRTLGERHPKVAASLNNLAVIAYQQGEDADALTIAGDALSIVGGSDGAEEVVALRIAMQAATRSAKYEESLRRATRLVEVLERGDDPVAYAAGLVELGHAHVRLRGFDAAALAFRRSIELDRRTRPGVAARTSIALADVERERGRSSARAEALADARTLAESVTPRDEELLRDIRDAEAERP